MQIVPGMSELTEHYWTGAKDHKLLIQHCRVCQNVWHPPLPRCPKCHSQEVDWVPAKGRGEVYSFTIVHHATHAAMADKVPYVVALVMLEEGLKVLTNIRNCEPDDVSVGMPVSLMFEELTPDITLPQFEPARS